MKLKLLTTFLFALLIWNCDQPVPSQVSEKESNEATVEFRIPAVSGSVLQKHSPGVDNGTLFIKVFLEKENKQIEYRKFPLAEILKGKTIKIGKLPAGERLLFKGTIIRGDGLETHEGSETAALKPGKTTVINLVLLKKEQLVAICLEIEGITKNTCTKDPPPEEDDKWCYDLLVKNENGVTKGFLHLEKEPNRPRYNGTILFQGYFGRVYDIGNSLVTDSPYELHSRNFFSNLDQLITGRYTGPESDSNGTFQAFPKTCESQIPPKEPPPVDTVPLLTLKGCWDYSSLNLRTSQKNEGQLFLKQRQNLPHEFSGSIITEEEKILVHAHVANNTLQMVQQKLSPDGTGYAWQMPLPKNANQTLRGDMILVEDPESSSSTYIGPWSMTRSKTCP